MAAGWGIMAAGFATAEFGIGFVLIGYGADVMATGATQMVTGKDEKTFTHKGVKKIAKKMFKASDKKATQIANSVELGLDILSGGIAIKGLYKLATRKPSLAAPSTATATEETAIATEEAASGEAAAGSTENNTTGYRYITEGEKEAIKETEMLRGGNPGETYFTKDIYKSSSRAQDRLSLPTTPKLRVEFEILNNPKLSLNGSKVLPDFKMSGKGAEFMTTDPVRVRIINIQPLK